MQYFYINEGATLPRIRMKLVKDGLFDYYKSAKFNNAIQNATVTFSMWDEKGRLCISKAPCSIMLSEDDGCEENYVIEYKWNERDTKTPGQYKGQFAINFGDDLYEEGVSYPGGLLITPIYEDLYVMVKAKV